MTVFLALLLKNPSLIAEVSAEPTARIEVRTASDIKWRKLNPARGDASPQAGTIWGDQTKDGESGFLVKFVDGFSSPPHIHNITYRGVVIGGALHNDDPGAEDMWMGVGSYWTQPAGEVHITSARGASIGYVEIQSGPYLVMPPAEAFDNGELPINVDAKNIVWLDNSDTTWIEESPGKQKPESAEVTFLWGSPEGDQINGTLLKLAAGFTGNLKTNSSTFKVVVIKGDLELDVGGQKGKEKLTAGGYIGSEGTASHDVSSDRGCTIYIRTKGKYTVVPK
ncbi:MAG: DUF4437 domain-containing protein [Planctomycetota bacterium]